MNKTTLAISMVLILSSSAAMADASKNDASNAILEAVTANNKVAETGFEWRDTYKTLLGPAKQAYQSGDYNKAIELANMAKTHAGLGLIQAETNKTPKTL